MLCLQCQKEEAIKDQEYGILPGKNCQEQNNTIPVPKSHDFASPLTKLHRKEYASEMFQPYVNGVLSREFVEAHGTDKLHGVGEKEIKKAKYVYGDMTRHHKMIENAKNKKTDVSKKLASKHK